MSIKDGLVEQERWERMPENYRQHNPDGEPIKEAKNIDYQAIIEASKKIDQGPWICKPRNYANDPDEEDDFAGYAVFTKHRGCLVDNGSAWGEYSKVATKEMLEYITLLDPTTVKELVYKAAAYDAAMKKTVRYDDWTYKFEQAMTLEDK